MPADCRGVRAENTPPRLGSGPAPIRQTTPAQYLSRHFNRSLEHSGCESTQRCCAIPGSCGTAYLQKKFGTFLLCSIIHPSPGCSSLASDHPHKSSVLLCLRATIWPQALLPPWARHHGRAISTLPTSPLRRRADSCIHVPMRDSIPDCQRASLIGLRERL